MRSRSSAAAWTAGPAAAAGKYGPGVSDTEIKIGNTWPYSGPVSVTSPLAREMAGYFKMINEKGGVNGRKIAFISLDDGYIPPKTMEQTRRLVERDNVLLMFGSLGTPTNMAVRPYLNSHKVPQLFVTTGSNSLIDHPDKYPYTMGFVGSYSTESRVFARYILDNHPNAKIGILYQDDDFGHDYMDPFIAALGDKGSKMVVAKASYAVSDPTVTSQIISLRSAGADTLFFAAQSRAAAQAIATARDQVGWNALILLPYVATAKSVVGSVGKKLTGVISTDTSKDPTDPAWANDPAVKEYLAWVKKYTPERDQASDAGSPAGYISAEAMTYVLKLCGDDLTRENVMNVVTHLHNVTFPLLLPGIALNTTPQDHTPVDSMYLKQFDGSRWVLISKGPIKGK